jgi:diguanylate cyclase (GGDEF)-like protein/PAS domain S-box-containing protein
MNKTRILIVEDESVVSLDIRMQLEKMGYAVIGAVATGEQAVDVALRDLPDLVLMDIKLKGEMDGIQAASIIRESIDIPVIFLTAFADEKTLSRAKVSGPFGYALKPLDQRELYINIEIGLYKHKLERALRESEERYMLALQGSKDGIWDWKINTGEFFFSDRWLSMLGYSRERVVHNLDGWLNLIHPEDRRTLKTALEDHIQGLTPHLEMEHRMMHQDGGVIWVSTRGEAIRDASGIAYRISGSQTDITERKKIEEQLLHNAFHDSLTGLPNRALIMERIERSIKRIKRRPEDGYGILFLDLDRFKMVNDTLGHNAGDQLLSQIARRFEKMVRSEDTVARLGGDEFIFLQEGINDLGDCEALAKRILSELQIPFEIMNKSLTVSGSIGIVFGEKSYEHADEVLRDADIAMYRAKTQGRNRHVVFRPDFRRRIVIQAELENRLRHALKENEFRLHYQPVVSLFDNKVVGFEALIRWQPEGYEMVSPAEFIPIAEECGLIIPIGDWVIETACQQLIDWQDRFHGAQPLWVSVNLSCKQFGDPKLGSRILEILEKTGLPPASLRLEITEGRFMENPKLAIQTLQKLIDRGVQIYIDDFGTGYSSLSSISDYPVNLLKIDRAFISLMESNDKNREIVGTIIRLAQDLKLETIAEGVETKGQIQLLSKLSCSFAQGYFFSGAFPPESIDKILGKNLELMISGKNPFADAGVFETASIVKEYILSPANRELKS